MQSAGVGIAGIAGVGGTVSGQGTNVGGMIQSTDDNVIQLQAVGDGSGDGLQHSESADADHVISWNSAWYGVSPDEIEGEWNPTLSLAPGETYTVELTNSDGAPHTFVIEDHEGSELVSSDGTDGEGETETVEFTATEDMAVYYCEHQPQSMRGMIDVGDTPGQVVDILVFSVTDGFRHGVIEFGNQQIEAMANQIVAETNAQAVNVDVIDDPDGDASEFPSDVDELEQYDTVVWNSTTGSPLDEDQQAAFEEYIENGGGYAGIHAASDTHYDWDWYGDLVGAYFEGHPEVQEGTVNVEDQTHPSTQHLPTEWDVYDEYYDFDENPRDDVNVLATLDQDSYDGAEMPGDDHPIAWYHENHGGRAWYTGLGHTEEMFEDQDFLDHVRNGIVWSAGLLDVNVLVFSVTDAFRHDIIEFGNQQIEGMSDQIAAATGAEEVTIDVIDDPDGDASEFPDDVAELQQYDTIVWNSTTGSPLDEDQQAAFEQYIQNGGGYAGIHAASDTHYEWEWYGDLVGAYFDGHPHIQDGDVLVEDGTHPSTQHLSSRWTVHDEFYDYDINPRGDVHVLATLDEDSYDGAEMSRVDHPIAWCHNYDGGRSWHTGLGHTEEVFEDEDFLEHIQQGILWSGGFLEGDASATVWDSYEQVELTTDLNEGPEAGPMSMSIAPDGRIFFVERESNVSVIDPDTLETTVALERDFWFDLEDGGLGIATDPNFEENNWIYLYYSPVEEELDPDDDMPYNLLSRFEVDGNELDPDSETEILRVHQQRETCCHSAGEIQFGPDGNLFLSTGDNTTPFESSGFTPIDETVSDPHTHDAQGTAGDTSDLRGSIIRITPHEDGSYSVPDDNLFTEAQGYGDEIEDGLVRPEIFAMGFRNPFRFDIDEETGWVYMADYGPDSGNWDADRGPIGIREYNQIRDAGNYGWPFTRGPNLPYIDYDFETGESIAPFDPDGPINDSVHNDGLEQLPPTEESTFFVPNGGLWDNFVDAPEDHDWEDGIWDVPDLPPHPEVTDGAPNGGPLVRLDADRADTALPDYFDGKWIIGEWNTGNFHVVSFDEDGELLEISPFLPELDLQSPQDMEIGPDGRFHYIEWGSGFDGNNPGIYRIDHVEGETGSPGLSLSLDSQTVAEGEQTTATATLTNPLGHSLENVEFSASVGGDSIELTALDETSIGDLSSGSNHQVTWELAVEEDAPGGEYDLSVEVSFVESGDETQLDSTASILVSTPASIPFALNSGGEEADEDVEIDDLVFETLPNPSVVPTGGGPNGQFVDEPIEGTDHQVLYQTEHWGGDLGYDVAVPNGTYDVTLHFAEIFDGNIDDGEGARVFDLSVQGELIHEEFDIYAESGGRTATTVVVESVEVTDGVLSISTETQADNTQFSGFEIREASAEPLSAPYGVNLGGDPAEAGSDLPVEIDGLEFDAEQPPQLSESWDDEAEDSFGGGTNDSADEFDVTEIDGTDHDSLYQTGRWGYDLAYDLEMQNGTYDVTLHFAEIFEGNVDAGEGARLFDVVVQGETVAEEYDPYAEAGGGFAAASLTVEDVEVDDDELSIEFPTVDDHSQCCGIEIREATAGPLSAPYGVNLGGDPAEAGSDLPVEVNGLEFDAEQPPQLSESWDDEAEDSFGGGSNDSADEFDVTEIDGTDHDSLYQTGRWGYDLAYDLLIQSGTYDVTLHFAEIFQGNVDAGEGTRLFDVVVQGETVAEEYDPYAEAGGGFAATSLTVEDVEVTNDELSIEFPTVEDHSQCCGIEIRSDGGSTNDAFDPAETIELEGDVDGWTGVSPDEIAGEENPTLSLETGEEYTLVWENTDGRHHDFAIENEDGDIVYQSDGISGSGETETVEFTVSNEMAEYLCTPHPQDMRGDLDLS
ncbi:ThuA domain-containing protein [Natrialbaceae archaeon A-arb3/5]